ELFHDPGGVAYAMIPVGGHRETWHLRSRAFKEWLARRHHERHGKAPNAQALVDATNVLAGKAIFDGPEHAVHLRLAEHGGKVYLDLGNDRWEAVEVDAAGWRVVAEPPVRFRRTRGMLPLPAPAPGGSLDGLRRFLNLPTGDDAMWVLVVAWLVGAFRPRGPYPILVAHGEQGAAKSTLQRVLRALIDPNKAALRSLPRDERDLMIAATNGWCLAFDNLSHIQDWLSDALCRIATGGGYATRELYSDQDETILDVQRPIALNGIEEVATRNDLLDRSIVLYLPNIAKDRRVPERRFWRDFEAARAGVLGAVLDAVASALKNESTVALAEHPRLADFAEWVVAAEPALPWTRGAFLEAYAGNQADANDLTLEGSPVAQAVRDLVVGRTEPWLGTATDLLKALEAVVDEQVKKQKAWPASARTLANALRRLAPNLRASGVDVAFEKRGRQRTRTIRIERLRDPASAPSVPSASASNRGKPADDGGASAGGADEGLGSADDGGPAGWGQDALFPGGNGARADDADAADDGTPDPPSEGVGGEESQRGRECVECGGVLPGGWGDLYCARHGGEARVEDREDSGDGPTSEWEEMVF
ncbi:MAG: hypothetical protein M3Q10_19395, partial [Chloroflexota bacterium]|nr:hypothetical protein [Chloroflexota bacterium]